MRSRIMKRFRTSRQGGLYSPFNSSKGRTTPIHLKNGLYLSVPKRREKIKIGEILDEINE